MSSASSSRRVVQRYGAGGGGGTGGVSTSASLTSLDGDEASTPTRETPAAAKKQPKPNSAPHNNTNGNSSVPSGRVVDSNQTPARDARNGNRRSSSSASNSTQQQDVRVSSAGSIVSRVRIDVATHRHAQKTPGGGGSDPQRQSRESTAAASSAAMTAGSHQSICRMERELGRSLPLNGAGSHVMLSASDLKQVRDTETLQFLQQNSELFVKYFRETHPSSANPTATTSSSTNDEVDEVKKRTSHTADDLARQVKVLCEEIETFITAVDYEGKEYQVQVGDDGVLPIPVGGLWDQEDQVVYADMEDFTEDELRAFNKEFGITSDEDDTGADGGDDADMMEETDSPSQPEESETDDHQGSDSNSKEGSATTPRTPTAQSDSSGLSTEDAIRKRFDDHRKLLALTGELALQRKLNAVVAHHKGDKPRYMSSTTASTNLSGAPMLPPSPPPAPAPPVKKFQVQYCGSNRPSGGAPLRVVDMPPVIPVREQRQTLSRDEEQRISFLLDHDDWESLSMDQVDGVEGRGGGGEETASVATTRKTAATSALSYDRASASSYAPSSGGYKADAQSQQRLRDIESQLEMLQNIRDEEAALVVNDAGGPPDRLLGTAPPPPSSLGSKGSTPQTSVSRSNAATSTRGGAKPSSIAAGSSSAAMAPMTAAAEAEKAAAQKRKAMGDGYLKNYREDKAVRQQLAAINGKLSAISSEMDTLMTPPFSFNTTYEMETNPSEWKWPDELQKPSEDAIQALLSVATREQRSAQRSRFMATLPGAPEGASTASRVLVNNFIPAELQDAAREAEEAQQRGDVVEDETAPPPASGSFHEQLREQLQRTRALAQQVSQLMDNGVHNSLAPIVDAVDATDAVEDADDDDTVPPSDGNPAIFQLHDQLHDQLMRAQALVKELVDMEDEDDRETTRV